MMEEFHGTDFDTPRDILRFVGTRLIRSIIDDEFWIKLGAERAVSAGPKVVITDCRFPNERRFFKDNGAMLIRIKRHDDGINSDHGINIGDVNEYDVIFDNCGTVHEFRSNVDLWYTMRREDLEFYHKRK